jgi:hypothetical protein
MSAADVIAALVAKFGAPIATLAANVRTALNTYDSVPTITTASLPNASPTTPYSQSLATVGGLGPLAFSIASGALPTGLALDPATGLISGTASTHGLASFTAKVTSASGFSSTKALTIFVPDAVLYLAGGQGPPGSTEYGYVFALNLRTRAWSVAVEDLPGPKSLGPTGGGMYSYDQSVALAGTLTLAGGSDTAYGWQRVYVRSPAGVWTSFDISALQGNYNSAQPVLTKRNNILLLGGDNFAQALFIVRNLATAPSVGHTAATPGGCIANGATGCLLGAGSPFAGDVFMACAKWGNKGFLKFTDTTDGDGSGTWVYYACGSGSWPGDSYQNPICLLNGRILMPYNYGGITRVWLVKEDLTAVVADTAIPSAADASYGAPCLLPDGRVVFGGGAGAASDGKLLVYTPSAGAWPACTGTWALSTSITKYLGNAWVPGYTPPIYSPTTGKVYVLCTDGVSQEIVEWDPLADTITNRFYSGDGAFPTRGGHTLFKSFMGIIEP